MHVTCVKINILHVTFTENETIHKRFYQTGIKKILVPSFLEEHVDVFFVINFD